MQSFGICTEHAFTAVVVNNTVKCMNKYVDPPYCQAKMYTCCVACCPLMSLGKYANGQMDTRPLHFTFYRGCGQRNKSIR